MGGREGWPCNLAPDLPWVIWVILHWPESGDQVQGPGELYQTSDGYWTTFGPHIILQPSIDIFLIQIKMQMLKYRKLKKSVFERLVLILSADVVSRSGDHWWHCFFFWWHCAPIPDFFVGWKRRMDWMQCMWASCKWVELSIMCWYDLHRLVGETESLMHKISFSL